MDAVIDAAQPPDLASLEGKIVTVVGTISSEKDAPRFRLPSAWIDLPDWIRPDTAETQAEITGRLTLLTKAYYHKDPNETLARGSVPVQARGSGWLPDRYSLVP